jgi:hypothetical protein
MWRRHPAHRLHHGAGADPEDPHPLEQMLEPPPVSPARGPPTDWGELVHVHDDRDIFQGRIDELPAIDIHSL